MKTWNHPPQFHAYDDLATHMHTRTPYLCLFFQLSTELPF